MTSYKLGRINADIAHAVSDILANESRDEILKTITVTAAEVTNDLSYAKIYFTSIADASLEDIESEVNEASRFVRGRLSERVNLRHTPELKFIYDRSIEYGKKIEDIIKNLD